MAKKATTKKRAKAPKSRKAQPLTALQQEAKQAEIDLRLACLDKVYMRGADHTISEAKKIYSYVKGTN